MYSWNSNPVGYRFRQAINLYSDSFKGENEWFNKRNINTCYPLGTLRTMVKIMDEIEAGLKKIEEKIEHLRQLEAKRDSLLRKSGIMMQNFWYGWENWQFPLLKSLD